MIAPNRQIGNLRVKDGVLQIRLEGRWKSARNLEAVFVMWNALCAIDDRLTSLERSTSELRGHYD
jgi:hypothetical protein